MKRILLALILGMFFFSLVSAQVETKPGITPEKRFLYGIDIALEKIRMAFTLGKENKVNYGLKIAEERLAEMEYIKDPTQFGEDFQFSISSGKRYVIEIENKRNVILQKVEDRAKELDDVDLNNKIDDFLNRHIEILKKIKSEITEEAQDGIQIAIDNSQRFKGRTY